MNEYFQTAGEGRCPRKEHVTVRNSYMKLECLFSSVFFFFYIYILQN